MHNNLIRPFRSDISLEGAKIEIETGTLAKQADGAVLVKCNNNRVLVTVVSDYEESSLDFFPLTVEYMEKFYATGKIPGGYFKREGKPTADATLAARMMDRPLRPNFPEDYQHEVQVIATILSSDGSFPLPILATLGASAALQISDIPFNGPCASVLMGRIKGQEGGGQWVTNRGSAEMAKSDAHIMVAGSRSGILMVEGECSFLSEEEVLEGLQKAHESIQKLLDLQDDLQQKVGVVEKRPFKSLFIDPALKEITETHWKGLVEKSFAVKEKKKRTLQFKRSFEEALALAKEDSSFASKLNACKLDAEGALSFGDLSEEEKLKTFKKQGKILFEDLKYKMARSMILEQSRRIDGRKSNEIRPIDVEVGFLPRAHGSGLFTRGETQVLGAVTLGTGEDEQMVDSLEGMYKKSFMLHYNFPPYCVGERGRLGFQSRREIGHGVLAERAIKAILPEASQFPYTLRLVSEVLESNGSSSMGTVCACNLALLDAGVPIKENVAGIAMGLIKEGDKFAILSDILGDEDHLGDMDFKVAGSHRGITALQMDIKVGGIDFNILKEALKQAHEGRQHILNEMNRLIEKPRKELSEFAPRIETIRVHVDKVREVIGPGGKMIRSIIEETGVKMDIQDDGTIHIASSDAASIQKAKARVEEVCAEVQVGHTYNGTVSKVVDFGAFVEILPNTSGLLHISEMDHKRIRQVSDVMKEGDTVEVKVMDVDRTGRIKLSRKALLEREN